MAVNFDREEILRTWNTFRQSGEVLELRIPKAGKHKTISGYFNDAGKLADAVIGLADEPFAGIYFTVNPVKADLLARASNRYVKYADTTTSDADIIALHWLPVDLDAKRPAGISSTDGEHEAALQNAREIRSRLIEEQGWPAGAFVLGDSGNGAHLNVKIDLPNLPENVALVKDCLEALDFLFSDDRIEVDTTSQNPARIWKLYGTKARKGDNTTDRPHRLSRLLEVPATIETVTREKLEALAAMLPEQEEQPKTYADGQGFDPVAYCQAHNLQVHHTKAYKGGTLAVLEECIFDSSHRLSACIIGWPNGARTYRCRHHSCLNKHWQDAKVKIEPFKSNLDNNLSRLNDIKQERINQKFEPEPEISIPELEARVKADPRILKEPSIIKFMAGLRANDGVEFDLLIEAIKRAGSGVKVATIAASLDAYDLENQKVTASPTEAPEGICNEAQALIDTGKSYEYIYEVWQKRVKGNQYLGKALILSRAVQSCLNSKGVHIYAHGKHGLGKSEGMEKMIELIPAEYKMDEDISPLAIHYASKNGMLIEATTLLIDEMVWSDALGGIIKRVITRFQKGAGHLTVIDVEPVLVRTQPRLAIWTNSADLQADEQLRDRFLDEPIDEGDKHVTDIIEFQKIRDTLPVPTAEVERETAICQDIIRDLASKTFTVKIPFAERIKIAQSEGTRGYNIFSDLVKGVAAMRYKQRKTNEQGQLIATEDDFKTAKEVYEGSKGHSEESYTTSEKTVLQAIINHGFKATYKEIKELTELSEGRIKDIVNGRGKDEQKRHGLRYKCPQLEVDKVDISMVTASDTQGYATERRTVHPNELTLPESFSVTAKMLSSLVTLEPDPKDPKEPRRKRSIPDVTPTQPIIDNKIDSDVVDVVLEERERDIQGKDESLLNVNNEQSISEAISSSKPLFKQKGYVDTSGCQTIAKIPTHRDSDPSQVVLADSDSSIRRDLDRANEEEKKKAEQFKTPGKPDLTGMSVKEIIALGLKTGKEAAKGKSVDEIIADHQKTALLDQAKVPNVSNVAIVANVATIQGESKEGISETLATLETNATLEILGALGVDEELVTDKPKIAVNMRTTASNPRQVAKPARLKFYPEMAVDVPNDMSSPEAEQICNAFRRSLRRGDAPRMDGLVKDTGLAEATILAYLDSAPWIRKDDSSPSGIVVYLPRPVEAAVSCEWERA
jgi:hypothetical protein